MPSNDDDLLLRLETTIESWSGEVTSAHSTLTHQIAEAKDQLSTLVKVIAAKSQNGHVLTETIDELQGVRGLLNRREEDLGRALRDNALLRDELEELRGRVQRGDEPGNGGPDPGATSTDDAVQSLSLELDAARDELQEALRELDEAHEEIHVGEAALRERDATIKVATEDAASFNDTLGTVQEELEALHAAATEASFDEEDDVAAQLVENQLAEAQQRTAEQQEQLASIQEQLDEKNRALDDTESELEELRKRPEPGTHDPLAMETLVRENETKDEQLQRTQKELASLEHRESDQSKALLVAKTQAEALRDELKERSSLIGGLEQRLSDVETRANELENAQSVSEEDAESEESMLHAEISVLKESVEDQERTIREYEDIVAEKDLLIEELNNKLTKTTARNVPLREDVSDETIDQLLTENEELKMELRDHEAELNSLRGRLGTDEDSADVHHERIELAAYDTNNRKRAMGEILVNAGIITRKQLERALEEQKGQKQRRLGNILVGKGLIHEEIVAQVLASQLKLQFVRLNEEKIETEATRLMNGRLATHHMCIPISVNDEGVTVAMANPHDLIALEDIEIATDRPVKTVVATLADITSAIVRCYGVDTPADPSESSMFQQP